VPGTACAVAPALGIFFNAGEPMKIVGIAVGIVLFLSILAVVFIKRIETGEVGIRIGFDKQIQPGELEPGSFNQTLIGRVLTFPVKDVNVPVNDMTPVAKDNSTMKDFDAVLMYNINPSQVAELYSTKSRAFHMTDRDDTYLMYQFMVQALRNAAYKAARKHEALDMADNRQAIEQEMREIIVRTLAEEKLDGSIQVMQVLVRNILPADSVVASANELVRAKNELKQKTVEVQTAQKEAERMAALSNQSTQSIAYMQAQAMLNISEGVKNGKVQTIIVPSNFTGLMMNK
jgi:regulator of protease activity HflC (stomatin/prohibitin superfamily)